MLVIKVPGCSSFHCTWNISLLNLVFEVIDCLSGIHEVNSLKIVNWHNGVDEKQKNKIILN